MKKVRIVIMGKTGVGKSTIINAVLGEEKAQTGNGVAITKKNQEYECKRFVISQNEGKYSGVNCNILLYDTVGLEIDQNITRETLQQIKNHIRNAKRNSNDEDVNIVWFCINEQSNRFESFEADLIKQLSIEYEIPFAIVLTQCTSRKSGKLAEEIKKKMPNIPIRRIMASDYQLDEEITIKAFGLDELIQLSINDYYQYKIKVMESIINELSKKSNTKIDKIEAVGRKCILDYAERAGRIGWLSGGCIPIVHGLCIKMITELNNVCGLSKDNNFADEIFTDIVVGVITTPFMAVPVISKFVAESYITTVGENYLNAMVDIIKSSTDAELKDKRIIKERLTKHLKKNDK